MTLIEGTVRAGTAADAILVVDLDGTLIRSDLLYESLFAAASASLAAMGYALTRLAYGRAAFKAALSARAAIDVALLPYNEAVVELVRRHREQGGHAILATASDGRLARAVAAHLGCFDEVLASDGARNLKGRSKAALLVERFGSGGFDYIGDSRADLSVWRHARRAITVNAAASLCRAVDGLGGKVRHLKVEAADSGLRPYLTALRPHQWIKNVLVFLPTVAAHSTNADQWAAAVVAFIAFSLVASSVYICNDLFDLAADRAHPRKRHRPFASGAVPLQHGVVLGAGTLALGIVCVLLVGEFRFLMVLVGYFGLTLAYSLYLKRRLVVDICTLAGLYTLRVLAGGVATGLTLSPWILAFSIFLFLSLAAIKRQAELVDAAGSGAARAAGRAYEPADLPIVAMMALAAGYAAVLVLAFYIDTPVVKGLYSQPAYLWGLCPILLYWISRMVMIAHRGRMDDDPIVFSGRDWVSRLCLLLTSALVAAGAVL